MEKQKSTTNKSNQPTSTEPAQEKTKEEKDPYLKMDLKECGNNLPVIRMDAAKQFIKNRSFTFMDWDMEVEEKLADVKASTKTVGGFVSEMMKTLLDQFCGTSFQDKNDGEKSLILNQMEFVNVMYMYIYLRTEEMGYELKLPVTCPTCRFEMQDFVADLRTFEIHVKNEGHKREKEFILTRPICIQEEMITSFMIGHSKWEAMENAAMEFSQNEAKIKQLLYKSSIVSFHNDKGVITKFLNPDDVIKKMKKIDIEKIANVIQDHNAGPLMALEGKCTKCKASWYKMLDWSYDFFFGSSSL